MRAQVVVKMALAPPRMGKEEKKEQKGSSRARQCTQLGFCTSAVAAMMVMMMRQGHGIRQEESTCGRREGGARAPIRMHVEGHTAWFALGSRRSNRSRRCTENPPASPEMHAHGDIHVYVYAMPHATGNIDPLRTAMSCAMRIYIDAPVVVGYDVCLAPVMLGAFFF
jgi:hypothetical protein